MSGPAGPAKNQQELPGELPAIFELIDSLERRAAHGMARKIAERALQAHPGESGLTRRLAHNTGLDDALQPARRFSTALELLAGLGLGSESCDDAETLVVGGDINIARWEYFGQIEYLYEALSLYRAASSRNPGADRGRGGVRAGFVYDLLAQRAELIARRSGTTPSPEAEEFRTAAAQLRQRVLVDLIRAFERDATLGKNVDFIASLAEVCFGLGDYAEAEAWLDQQRAQAAQFPAEAREVCLQSSFRRLAQLARHQGIEPPADGIDEADWHPAWKALRALLGEDTARALPGSGRKLGLALSGGGFRASLFHLGVLARLAEVDALRAVECLSTVSGGSIVGAQYYLELQRLIESRPDSQISREDYIALVRRLQQGFVAGVQRNIRMRAFASFPSNVRMLLNWGYTRSHRVGELYESELFARVADGKTSAARSMPQLLMQPRPEPGAPAETFRPRSGNGRRRAKVPVLLLNTTSLNSGHNWFFTASWMGEPPGLLGDEADVNERYRRLYYRQAPNADLQNFRLGHAVAASSCVPGLFDPLVIEGLYPDRTVRLVNGGVHDNQGLQGLLDERCTLILCSDASGQMPDLKQPASDTPRVLVRVSTILQDRLREAQVQDMRDRLEGHSLDGLMFLHSRKDLQSHPLDWLGCDDPGQAGRPESPVTSYGVWKDLQALIAGLRTDLDAFTDVEAHALMASGYRMATHELGQLQREHERLGHGGTWGGFDIGAAQRDDWPFSRIGGLLGEPPGSSAARDDVAAQLDAGRSMFLKAWKLVPPLQWRGRAALAAVALTLLIALSQNWSTVLLTWGGLSLVVGTALAASYLPAIKWLNPTGETRNILIKIGIALVGYVLSVVHLRVIDPLLLARGRLDRLPGNTPPSTPTV